MVINFFEIIFSCNIGVCVELLAMVVETDMLLEGTKCKHLLWALYFLKNYSTYFYAAANIANLELSINKIYNVHYDENLFMSESFLNLFKV